MRSFCTSRLAVFELWGAARTRPRGAVDAAASARPVPFRSAQAADEAIGCQSCPETRAASVRALVLCDVGSGWTLRARQAALAYWPNRGRRSALRGCFCTRRRRDRKYDSWLAPRGRRDARLEWWGARAQSLAKRRERAARRLAS